MWYILRVRRKFERLVVTMPLSTKTWEARRASAIADSRSYRQAAYAAWEAAESALLEGDAGLAEAHASAARRADRLADLAMVDAIAAGDALESAAGQVRV